MTDTSNLIQSAVNDLKATTISYPQWERNCASGKYADPLATKWGSALDKLTKAINLEISENAGGPPAVWVCEPPRAPITAIVGSSSPAYNLYQSPGTVKDTLVNGGGDSTVIIQPNAIGSVVSRVQLYDVANLNSVPYGKHGIYGKARGLLLEDVDVTCSKYAASGVSLRFDGAVLQRSLIGREASGRPFIGVSYYETSDVAGTVTISQAKIYASDVPIWITNESSYQSLVRQQFVIRDVESFSPGSYFLTSANIGPTCKVTIQNCTYNGKPVTASMVKGVPSAQLVIA